MKKILLASLVAFCLIATGSSMAWKIDLDSHVRDAKLDLQFSTTGTDWDGDSYLFATTAGVDGYGKIDIDGHGYARRDQGTLTTEVKSRDGGAIYATQTLGTRGCLEDCAERPCCDVPRYSYYAESFAAIDGTGKIFLTEGENVRICCDNYNGQILKVHGEGDFKAGLGSTLWVGDQEPVSHQMGAWGENVEFCAFGIQGMDNSDGANGGFFTAKMHFCDPPCPEPPCGDDDDDDCVQ